MFEQNMTILLLSSHTTDNITGSKWKVAILYIVNSYYDPVGMLGITRFYYNVSIV